MLVYSEFFKNKMLLDSMLLEQYQYCKKCFSIVIQTYMKEPELSALSFIAGLKQDILKTQIFHTSNNYFPLQNRWLLSSKLLFLLFFSVLLTYLKAGTGDSDMWN